MFIALYLFLKILQFDKFSKFLIKFISTPIRTVFPKNGIMLLSIWEFTEKWIHQHTEINCWELKKEKA